MLLIASRKCLSDCVVL